MTGLAVGSAAHCNVFDPSLQATAGGGGSAVENWAACTDACPVPEAKLLNSDVRQHSGVVVLNSLADDIQDIGKLTGFDGPDGVFGFEVAALERVSINAEFVTTAGQEAPEVDLGLYLTGACDSASFVRRNDRCPAGKGEEMWWQTSEPSTFYLGFDSRAYDYGVIAPQVRLSLTYPRFGDNVLERGEACDDGNLVDGDGCTHDGLVELVSNGSPVQEVEPNNHPTGSNVVALARGETIQIIGYIGGSCDNDFFGLDVEEGAFPRVTMLTANGQACPEGTPVFPLEFNQLLGDSREQTKLGDATIPADAGGSSFCPAFDETSFAVSELTAGRYVVELKAFDQGQHEPFHYLLRIEMLEPSGGTGGSGTGGGGTGGGGTGGGGAGGA